MAIAVRWHTFWVRREDIAPSIALGLAAIDEMARAFLDNWNREAGAGAAEA